ncbi:hypothetical protein SLA2020_275930 [Shorea laevis]
MAIPKEARELFSIWWTVQPMDCGLVEITRKDHVKLLARSIFKEAQKMKNTLKAFVVDEQVAVNTISSSTIEMKRRVIPCLPSHEAYLLELEGAFLSLCNPKLTGVDLQC